ESDTSTPEMTEVVTPLYRAELSSRGAGLVSWKLAKYRDSTDRDAGPVELVTPGPQGQAALATPFVELGLGDLTLASFRLVSHDDASAVFEYSAGGLTVRKTFTFDKERYQARLNVDVRNDSAQSVSPGFFVAWPMVQRGAPKYFDERLSVMHQGSVHRVPVTSVGDPGLLAKLFGASSTPTQTFDGDIDWVAAESRYFLAAMIPDLPREAIARFARGEEPRESEASLGFRPVELPSSHAASREIQIYVGPKDLNLLGEVGSHLERTVDLGYSWVAPLTRVFGGLLHAVYAVIPNYGVAIIVLTVLVRVATAPLTTRQMRSMAKMGNLQPRIKELQEKFADDRPRQSQEMMKLYKESGVNPLGGCLPILLQFPVFIGLYYALQSSIDLRHAPFFGWIRDLSAPEQVGTLPIVDLPIRILPIVMGGSMVLQQRLTPSTSMDPAQARMMMTVMPVMFTVLFYQFPSGLVLYWLVSNLLAVGHQYWLKRSMNVAK
ncbi:MAG TPA: membrane protein insertase YidC, partial [Myxococcota bacterium]|nr:membrane protein insertase YidC [Myxococcota bacterium]